jgi:hypothetical protein
MRRVHALTAADDPHVPTPPEEVWRPVPEWEGWYDVSSHGRVRSWRRRGSANLTAGEPVEILGYTHHTGRRQVQLRRGQDRRPRYVHDLVLTAFVGPRPPGCDGAHLNGDPADNRVGNLRWATVRENSGHRAVHGTYLHGERSHAHVLLEEEAAAIRLCMERGVSSLILAAAFGVDKSTICRIGAGTTWKEDGLPDLGDPATVGCLLAMLPPNRWAVTPAIGGGWTVETRGQVHGGPTLGEAVARALIAVWEAA